jgi:ATP-dependent DNA helicase RecQ
MRAHSHALCGHRTVAPCSPDRPLWSIVAMDPTAALRQTFGFDAFRPGQEDAVRAAIGPPARDVLVVMPTGAGKSLCYQLPALVREDLTLVVSPLVSLMQDQVDALAAIAPGRVALVNAQRDAAANRDALERAASGELRLLYVAPERFSSAPFLQAIRDTKIGLFVVDEAHCVSQWGHDFRPDYFRLADAARWLQAEAIIASTATATPQVADDIVQRLGLRDPVRVATGFDRPNLSFAVLPCASTQAKHRHIAAALAQPGATPAIVYAGTRAGSEKLAGTLSGTLDGSVGVYHAGLGREQRADVQRRFMDGRLDVVVATNAFGMGIDKADVRTVCHESVPGSIEAYYQEAGRAGRDGRPARALLFAEGRDKGLHVFFIQRSEVSDEAIATVARRLQMRATEGRYDLGTDELAAVLDGRGENDDRVRAVIGHLARAGVLRPAPSSPDRLRGRIETPFDGRARAACRTSAGEGQRARWRQYRAVWAFVEGNACRRATILRHFGDARPPAPAPGVPCCDVCDGSWVPAAPANASRRRRADADATNGTAIAPGDLDAAILEVVETAQPAVGRTRAVEILRGGRSQALVKSGHDGLPAYGTFDHLTAKQVLARIDELLQGGRLRSTGGMYPKLEAG